MVCVCAALFVWYDCFYYWNFDICTRALIPVHSQISCMCTVHVRLAIQMVKMSNYVVLVIRMMCVWCFRYGYIVLVHTRNQII